MECPDSKKAVQPMAEAQKNPEERRGADKNLKEPDEKNWSLKELKEKISNLKEGESLWVSFGGIPAQIPNQISAQKAEQIAGQITAQIPNIISAQMPGQPDKGESPETKNSPSDFAAYGVPALKKSGRLYPASDKQKKGFLCNPEEGAADGRT